MDLDLPFKVEEIAELSGNSGLDFLVGALIQWFQVMRTGRGMLLGIL